MLFGYHFARQVRKNARVNFHVPFRRECHGSETARLHVHWRVRTGPRSTATTISIGAWTRSVAMELRNQCERRKIRSKCDHRQQRVAALEPILTSARVSIAIPELLMLTATPARILADINYYQIDIATDMCNILIIV